MNTATPGLTSQNVLNYLTTNQDDMELVFDVGEESVDRAVQEVVRAVNTFDEAKAALEAILPWMSKVTDVHPSARDATAKVKDVLERMNGK